MRTSLKFPASQIFLSREREKKTVIWHEFQERPQNLIWTGMFFIQFLQNQIIWAILCIYSLIHDRNRNTVYLRERTLQSLFCRSAVHFHRDGPEVMTDHNTLTKHHKGTCKTMKNIIKSWLTRRRKKIILSQRKTNSGKCQAKHPALQKKEVIISNMKCLWKQFNSNTGRRQAPRFTWFSSSYNW